MKWLEKWFKRRQIDAAEELDTADENRIEGARGPSVVGEQRRAKTAGLAGLAIAIALLCALIFGGVWWAGQQATSAMTPPAQPKKEKVGQVIPDIKTDPVRVEPSPLDDHLTPPPSPDLITSFLVPPQQPAAAQPTTSAPKAPEYQELKGNVQGGPQQQIAVAREDRQDDAYGKMLRPTRTDVSVATLRRNPDFTVSEGREFTCILAWRIVTDQPGPIKCNIEGPILSDSGNVVLLEDGSPVTGVQRGGLAHGKTAIFALWQRAIGKHADVKLDSPAAGPMGESGLSGYVDSHFWDRIKLAAAVSIIGDLGSGVAGVLGGRRSGGGNQIIQFGGTAQGTSDAASEALRATGNIDPTLYKDQGDRVTVVLARDLDFSRIYRLEAQ